MPRVVFHKLGQRYEGEVRDNTNLVVRAGIRQYPHPHLRYGCGMGKCSRCACEVIAGAEHLPPPNPKENKVLRYLARKMTTPAELPQSLAGKINTDYPGFLTAPKLDV